MTVGEIIARELDALPAGLRALLAKVSIDVRERPNAVDLARGARPDQRGYFWGSAPDRLEPGIAVSSELPDLVPPEGEIVLFTANIVPLTEEHLRRVLLHEVGHAFGYSEEDLVQELGLC